MPLLPEFTTIAAEGPWEEMGSSWELVQGRRVLQALAMPKRMLFLRDDRQCISRLSADTAEVDVSFQPFSFACYCMAPTPENLESPAVPADSTSQPSPMNATCLDGQATAVGILGVEIDLSVNLRVYTFVPAPAMKYNIHLFKELPLSMVSGSSRFASGTFSPTEMPPVTAASILGCASKNQDVTKEQGGCLFVAVGCISGEIVVYRISSKNGTTSVVSTYSKTFDGPVTNLRIVEASQALLENQGLSSSDSVPVLFASSLTEVHCLLPFPGIAVSDLVVGGGGPFVPRWKMLWKDRGVGSVQNNATVIEPWHSLGPWHDGVSSLFALACGSAVFVYDMQEGNILGFPAVDYISHLQATHKGKVVFFNQKEPPPEDVVPLCLLCASQAKSSSLLREAPFEFQQPWRQALASREKLKNEGKLTIVELLSNFRFICFNSVQAPGAVCCEGRYFYIFSGDNAGKDVPFLLREMTGSEKIALFLAKQQIALARLVADIEAVPRTAFQKHLGEFGKQLLEEGDTEGAIDAFIEAWPACPSSKVVRLLVDQPTNLPRYLMRIVEMGSGDEEHARLLARSLIRLLVLEPPQEEDFWENICQPSSNLVLKALKPFVPIIIDELCHSGLGSYAVEVAQRAGNRLMEAKVFVEELGDIPRGLNVLGAQAEAASTFLLEDKTLLINLLEKEPQAVVDILLKAPTEELKQRAATLISSSEKGLSLLEHFIEIAGIELASEHAVLLAERALREASYLGIQRLLTDHKLTTECLLRILTLLQYFPSPDSARLATEIIELLPDGDSTTNSAIIRTGLVLRKCVGAEEHAAFVTRLRHKSSCSTADLLSQMKYLGHDLRSSEEEEARDLTLSMESSEHSNAMSSHESVMLRLLKAKQSGDYKTMDILKESATDANCCYAEVLQYFATS